MTRLSLKRSSLIPRVMMGVFREHGITWIISWLAPTIPLCQQTATSSTLAACPSGADPSSPTTPSGDLFQKVKVSRKIPNITKLMLLSFRSSMTTLTPSHRIQSTSGVSRGPRSGKRSLLSSCTSGRPPKSQATWRSPSTAREASRMNLIRKHMVT